MDLVHKLTCLIKIFSKKNDYCTSKRRRKHRESPQEVKRKFEKTGVVKELRARQQFDKPSVLKRLKMEHAIYVQKLRAAEE